MKEYLKKADILGLAIIAAALITYSVRSTWSVYQTIAVAAGGIVVLASLVAKFDDIKAGLRGRSARFGANSVTSVLLMVGILGLVNYLGAQHVKRFDMTTEKIYSLSDESANVAAQVPEDLHIKAFFPGGDDPSARELLELLPGKNNRISFEFIDPDKQPQIAQQYAVTTYGASSNPLSGESVRYGTLVFEMGGKTGRIEKPAEPLREEDVTNTLLRIVKGEQKTVYLVEGHGEESIDDTDRTGYSVARGVLERENYIVDHQSCPAKPGTCGCVPSGYGRPTSEPFPNELDALDTYLKNGGSALILLDPAPGAALKDFMAKWSVDVGNNVVLDATGMGRLLGIGSGGSAGCPVRSSPDNRTDENDDVLSPVAFGSAGNPCGRGRDGRQISGDQ